LSQLVIVNAIHNAVTGTVTLAAIFTVCPFHVPP
jgi:hypothetical protein